MKTWVCPICGYQHEGENPPENCPICNLPAEKFKEAEENYSRKPIGPIAQLEAYRIRIARVGSSILPRSTKEKRDTAVVSLFFFCKLRSSVLFIVHTN